MAHRGNTFDPSDRRRSVQSVNVSVDILRALARGPGPMSLKEISLAVDMAAAKVHRYLASFVEAGMVEHRRSDTYDLGPLAVEIGISAIGRLDFVNRAADRLNGLVDATGATALLSVWGNKGPTVVRWERAPTNLHTNLGLGSVLPLLRSATGQVFLGFLPQRVTAALVDDAIAATGDPATRRDVETLRQRVRAAGCAAVDQTFIPGLFAASAPVLNWQGEAEAAVTLIGVDQAVIEPRGAVITTLKSFSQTLAVDP